MMEIVWSYLVRGKIDRASGKIYLKKARDLLCIEGEAGGGV